MTAADPALLPGPPTSPSPRMIRLRGVEVHNLQQVDLDLPQRRLIVFCGVSGSGKSSLALDTLYAEGQRRYIESFSSYARQFLERLERPAAESIEGLPPAVAVVRQSPARAGRATVATSSEIHEYLRLLFAKVGEVHCRSCGRRLRRESAPSVASLAATWPAGVRFMIAFALELTADDKPLELAAQLREAGFRRVICGGRQAELDEPAALAELNRSGQCLVVVDRLVSGDAAREGRLIDSLETAFAHGRGRCAVLWEAAEPAPSDEAPSDEAPADQARADEILEIDGRPWRRQWFSERLECPVCRIEAPPPDPRLFSFQSPLGACPRCEGFGSVLEPDLDLVVPDPTKSLREGAVAAWSTPAYAHELQELLALAPDYGIDPDVPFDQLDENARRLIDQGVPERNFGGLQGFFRWLEKHAYQTKVRVFLSRWRSPRPCPECLGTRLRPEALSVKLGGVSIAELTSLPIAAARARFAGLALDDWQRQAGRQLLEQVGLRLQYLEDVGLGYLTLDRAVRTLSGGEAQRVALTSTLGSNLVNMLYILDEPSAGLHPRDVPRLLAAVEQLRDRGNTVLAVEHEEAFIRAADQVVEIGPGAGPQGGRVVFQGSPAEMAADENSLTGAYLSGRRGGGWRQPRTPQQGAIRLTGARGNNLKNLHVEFPLGLLCVVAGVSGSGKSSLVGRTLYPALCRRLGQETDEGPLPLDDLTGHGPLKDVALVDQSPAARTARSNPVTYVKAFDEIRAAFAETVDARTRGFGPGHFSFNVAGGRCETCQGEGQIHIDMQFLADVAMTCPQCHGARYRPEVLQVRYRDRSIADVLNMTAREAFAFFRGLRKVQQGLKRLMDVGLDYIRLGQNAGTLSGGESQRLKLAGFLAASKRSRTLFLLDEPTTGLHFLDVVKLLDCFEALLADGHSLIVVEHNLQLIRQADYVIELGPGAGEAGGEIIAAGPPAELARNPQSNTGPFLGEPPAD